MIFALLLLAGRTYFPVPVCKMKTNDHRDLDNLIASAIRDS